MLIPIDGSGFDPRNWFKKEYELGPYCEYEGGVHKVNFCVKFKKPRVWWEKTAPKLAFGVKVLAAGIKIACAGLPVGIDPKIFEEIKNEVAFMKELAGHLELEGGGRGNWVCFGFVSSRGAGGGEIKVQSVKCKIAESRSCLIGR